MVFKISSCKWSLYDTRHNFLLKKIHSGCHKCTNSKTIIKLASPTGKGLMHAVNVHGPNAPSGDDYEILVIKSYLCQCVYMCF